MEEVFYTKDNYWVIIENDIATIGLSDFLTDEMDIINYAELPTIGSQYNKTDLMGIINYNNDHNLDLYAPFSGEVIDTNDSLEDNYDQLISEDKYNSWLCRISINSKEELEEELMTEEEYRDFIEENL